MKISTLTVQQLFILKVMKDNPTFEIRLRGNQYWVFDGKFQLFLIQIKTYENLKTLKLV